MSKRNPWMPFDGIDFYSSEAVNLMPADAEAAYLRLLWIQWQNGSLPDDPASVRQLLPAKFWKRFSIIWPLLERKFPVVNGRRFNERANAERSRALELLKKAQKGAEATNGARWGSHSDSHSDRPATRTATEERHAERVADRAHSTSTSTSTSSSPSDATHPTELEAGAVAPPPPPPSIGKPETPSPKPPDPPPQAAERPRRTRKAKNPEDRKRGEHEAIVELWQKAWADYRHPAILDEHGIDSCLDRPVEDIPVAAKYLPTDADYVAAAKLWKHTCGDLLLVRRRMKNLFESTAPFVSANASLVMLRNRWSQFEVPAKEFEFAERKGAG